MNDKDIQFHDFADEGEVIFIDKPQDWTSFDVVKKVRVLFDVRKVGHAGTLDPKATGLLIVCTGKKTKIIEQFTRLEKEYIGTCELGVQTPSFDLETAVHERKDSSAITEDQLQETSKFFFGKQLQVPPMYSAVKYGGKPLYRYARAGRTVERVEREINIMRFELLNIRKPFVDFCIICSTGTYIRSLINEFGLRLGCGATLTALRRTRIGNYNVKNALDIETLIQWRNSLSIFKKSNNDTCEAN